MINRTAITQWNKIVPWNDNAQVEQDLIISRALVAIFSDKFLASQLAFRGGTALHKLYLSPQPRYSEDIDLVQITPGPIKPIMFKLGEVLSFLPDRVTKQKRYNNTMLFRMESEIPPTIPLRLKMINKKAFVKSRISFNRLSSGMLFFYFSGITSFRQAMALSVRG